MTKDQKIVAVGAASGILTMAIGLAVAYRLLPIPADLPDLVSRIGYALQAVVVAAIPLFAGIFTVGNNRFHSDAIDPTLQLEDKATVINGRFTDNTLQQYVLFVVAILGLSVNLSAAQMKLIPAAACVFVVARFAFWTGYRIMPLYRAAGMAATMYLNLGLLVFAGWKMVA